MTCPCDRTNVYRHSAEVLGTGTFGVVYATKHKDYDTALVVKSFAKENLHVAMAEVYVLEKLGPHPNIVVLWDAWLGHRAQGHIVLERFGSSLHHFLHRASPKGYPMDLVGVRGITRDIARALCYVHSRGILHADVKPGNILHMSHKAKLCDWGSALEARNVSLLCRNPLRARVRTHMGRQPPNAKHAIEHQ